MMGMMVAILLWMGQSIMAPEGQKVVLTAEGRGVQIYACKAGAWTFMAPEAKLYVSGVEVGSHGAGPMWRYKDGSVVRGKVMATEAAPEAGAVPWLLLKSAGSEGRGLLADVTYIRRTDTKGGQAEVTGCDAAHEGSVSRVGYTATYTFYAGR
jgi:hypothetical protein